MNSRKFSFGIKLIKVCYKPLSYYSYFSLSFINIVDDPEKDNVAQEVFDAPNIEGLAFADDVPKQPFNIEQKRALDSKKHDDPDYKDMQHEEEGDGKYIFIFCIFHLYLFF